MVESGWDTVLKEAKDAGIPVILTDRAVDSPDTSLYKTFIGSDFVQEGKKAGEWLVEGVQGHDRARSTSSSCRAPPARPRPTTARKASREAIDADPNFKIIASQTGEFTRAKGKEVMEAFLKANPDIDVLYAHNDDMGLGAIEAIEAAGKKPGDDIKIITIDAVKDGMQALADGKINFIVECSPLLGPQLMDLVKKVHAGETIPTADRDRGDHLHPGAGQGRPARPQVLIHLPVPGGRPRHGGRPTTRDHPDPHRDPPERGAPMDADPDDDAASARRSPASRPSTTSTSGCSRARSTPSWARTAPASRPSSRC